MNIRDIDYFAVIAEHGHVGRAAEALGLGQPALSMSLRRLEKSLQAKLVKRTPKGIELTAVGAALLTRVRRLQLARDDVMREAADLSQGRAGHLRIGVTSGFAEDAVAASQHALLKDTPGATLKVSVMTIGELLAALRNGQFDLIISAIPTGSSEDIVHEHLLDDEFVVFTSLDHRLAKHKRILLADLARERWVTPSGTSALSWQVLSQAFESHGLPPPPIAVESNSLTVRLHAVASSELLGFDSRLNVKRAAARFHLAMLHVKELTWIRRNGVSYRRDTYLSPVAQRFIQILKATAA